MKIIDFKQAEKMDTSALFKIYTQTFNVTQAETEEQREQAYRLRYQVYCEEKSFEDPAANPNGMEKDEYDNLAKHSLLIHRETGTLVGTVRTIFPNLYNPFNSFPLQKAHDHPLLKDEDFILSSVELSRFCISKSIRKRVGDGMYGKFEEVNPQDTDSMRKIPHAALGLFRGAGDSIYLLRAAYDTMLSRGRVNLLGLVEPTLQRLLSRIGVKFDTLGDPVEHHGKRYLISMNPLQVLDAMKGHNEDFWKLLSDNGRIHDLALSVDHPKRKII